MPVGVLVVGVTQPTLEAVLDELDAAFNLPMTSLTLRDDGLVVTFASAAAAGQVLDAEYLAVGDFDYPVTAVTLPDKGVPALAAPPRSTSPGPSASMYEEEYEEEEEEEEDYEEEEEPEEVWGEEPPPGEPPPARKFCDVFPKHFRRTLSGIGCIVSASLAVMGLVRIVQNWANPIEGYQLFARWLFPFLIIFGGLNLFYAEIIRLHPHLQLGNWRPGGTFRHRGTRGVVYIMVGSVSMDLNQMAIVVGFSAMLLGLLNLIFGIWYHCKDCLHGRVIGHSDEAAPAEEVPVEEDDPGAYVEDEEAPGQLIPVPRRHYSDASYPA